MSTKTSHAEIVDSDKVSLSIHARDPAKRNSNARAALLHQVLHMLSSRINAPGY